MDGATSAKGGVPSEQIARYPPSPGNGVVETLHGIEVSDPYRSLEDVSSSATRDWIAAENELTQSWLGASSARGEIVERLRELWDYPRDDTPFERGGRWFQLRNSGLQLQKVLYVMDAPDKVGTVLLDPVALGASGTVALSSVVPSPDGTLCAYSVTESGSDWLTWRVRDSESSEDLPDVVRWSKFSTASWLPDGSGFVYVAPEPPDEGSELEGETRLPRVLIHRLGSAQDDDQVLFETPHEPEWLLHGTVTEDGRYVVVQIGQGTRPEQQVRVIELESDAGAIALVDDFSALAYVIGNVGSTFYLLTDAGAERRRVVAAELGADRASWTEVIPEDEATLLDVFHRGGRLVCSYLRDAQAALRVHELDGTFVHDVDIPSFSSLVEIWPWPAVTGRSTSSLIHFSTDSFTTPRTIWGHDVTSGATHLVRSTSAKFASADYVTERLIARSADGTQVPMFLSRRRDVRPTGEVATLLYGYGGFDIAVTPFFQPDFAVFMERGGLLAVANLRGGGEYGRSWNEQGRLQHKQNVFDDFCACARQLADSGWTSASRIAINGASNGGLLVGACLTQHPELFGAAIPEVGVLDMLRFHRFTIGWAWTSDFGDPEVAEDFRTLLAYSPLHNVRPADYPATLVVTGDHDDRVVPAHSLKFAAALQASQLGAAPILIRIETSTGHGAGKPTDKAIVERADVLAFIDRALTGSEGRLREE